MQLRARNLLEQPAAAAAGPGAAALASKHGNGRAPSKPPVRRGLGGAEPGSTGRSSGGAKATPSACSLCSAGPPLPCACWSVTWWPKFDLRQPMKISWPGSKACEPGTGEVGSTPAGAGRRRDGDSRSRARGDVAGYSSESASQALVRGAKQRMRPCAAARPPASLRWAEANQRPCRATLADPTGVAVAEVAGGVGSVSAAETATDSAAVTALSLRRRGGPSRPRRHLPATWPRRR